MFASFRLAAQEARNHNDLYFAGLLSQQDIQSAMGDAGISGLRVWAYWEQMCKSTFTKTVCIL